MVPLFFIKGKGIYGEEGKKLLLPALLDDEGIPCAGSRLFCDEPGITHAHMRLQAGGFAHLPYDGAGHGALAFVDPRGFRNVEVGKPGLFRLSSQGEGTEGKEDIRPDASVSIVEGEEKGIRAQVVGLAHGHARVDALGRCLFRAVGNVAPLFRRTAYDHGKAFKTGVFQPFELNIKVGKMNARDSHGRNIEHIF